MIIEAEGALGGLASLGLVTPLISYISGLGRELVDELEKIDGVRGGRLSDPEKVKLVMDRLASRAGCDVLLVTRVVEALASHGQIRGVVIDNKSGRSAVSAKRVIDCTGDADVAYTAGVETMHGRESDGLNQACSTDFILGGVDWEKYRSSEVSRRQPHWMQEVQQAVHDGELPYPIDNSMNWLTRLPGRPEQQGKDEVCICFAHSRNCDAVDAGDLTRMYMEGREQVATLTRFIRNRIAGFENSYLVQTASLLGVRESRRIVGDYVLTAMDVASGREFDDVVTITNHSFDVHCCDRPGNRFWAEMEIDGKARYVAARKGALRVQPTCPPPNGARLVNYRGEPAEEAEFPDHSEVPYRSLLPAGLDDLLVAGRCLSADFMAQSASRLILTCMSMGQAAGTAAALSLREGVSPRRIDVGKLQRQLVHDGLNLGQEKRQIPALERA